MAEALECCKNFDMIKNFKKLTKECRERCFLALWQLQKQKVKKYFFLIEDAYLDNYIIIIQYVSTAARNIYFPIYSIHDQREK